MDGANNHPDTTRKLIAMDIADAAEKLYAELLDEKLRGDRCDWGYGPSVDVAWDRYVERGAHNYAWWLEHEDCEYVLNDAGLAAYARFEAAFEQAELG